MAYQRCANIRKRLTLVLLAYLGALFTVNINWLAPSKGSSWPSFPLSGDSFTMIHAVLGTTISP